MAFAKLSTPAIGGEQMVIIKGHCALLFTSGMDNFAKVTYLNLTPKVQAILSSLCFLPLACRLAFARNTSLNAEQT